MNLFHPLVHTFEYLCTTLHVTYYKLNKDFDKLYIRGRQVNSIEVLQIKITNH